MTQKDEGREICEGIEKLGSCPEGKIPTLAPENEEYWRLFCLMSHGLIQPNGGYDYKAMEIVFNAYQVPLDRRARYIENTTIIIGIIEAMRKAEREKAGR